MSLPRQEAHSSSSHQNQRKQPRDLKPQLVQAIERLLEKQGIEHYEKNVAN